MIEPNNRYTIIVSINKRLNEITNIQYITVNKIAKYFNFPMMKDIAACEWVDYTHIFRTYLQVLILVLTSNEENVSIQGQLVVITNSLRFVFRDI